MLVESIRKIWNDDTLYGHALTNSFTNLWNFSTANPNYFVPKFNDSNFICVSKSLFKYKFEKITRFPNGKISSIAKIEKTRYVIFELSELVFRRIGGSCLTAISCVTLAPLGLAIKTIQKFAKT